MTLEEALLELLDHVGEDVHVGIMLPGGVPWAGCHGVLRHEAQQLLDLAAGEGFYFSSQEEERERDRHWAQMLLARGDQRGRFMVDGFVVPLTAEHVDAVRPTDGGEHPGLDFTVGLVVVRVTFAERAR